MTRLLAWKLHAVLASLLLLGSATLVPVPVYAQQATPQCNQFVLQNVLPLLQVANRFNPNGVYPFGFAPVVQPFATNPLEYTYYPAPMPWVSSYAFTPIYAPAIGGNIFAPPTPPAAPAPPAFPVPDLVPYAAGEPIPPELDATTILAELRASGALDRMSETERADWLIRLANLQRDQANYRRDSMNSQRDTLLAQYTIQREAYNAALAARRAAYDLANNVQNLVRGWRDTYTSYASVALNLLNVTCGAGTLTGPGNLAELALRCRTLTPFDPACVLVR